MKFFTLILFLVLPCVPAHAGAVSSSEYQYRAVMDPKVLPGVYTEVWGKLYRPTNLGNGKHPLIVMLHGNHPTCGTGANPIQVDGCQYTFSGSCPAGDEQIYSFRGYDYLANELAARGYLVVSINANRGITCGTSVMGDSGLNLARGRLVLRHLALLSQWNHYGNAPAALGVDLRGKIDFNEVGFFGHSRGGEGVRAAYNLYQDAGSIWKNEIQDPLSIKGIFEVGPVDGQTSRVLNANGTAWNVLLPMCDGDVKDLEGMKPFDRMSHVTDETPALPKSILAVWGANHNFYNTAWQVSDSPGCVGHSALWSGNVGSADQRQTAIESVIPFFVANVGSSLDRNQESFFNPLENQSVQNPRMDHAFQLASNSKLFSVMDHFSDATAAQLTFTQTAVPEHDASMIAAKVKWTQSSSQVYFENDWMPAGQGSDASRADTFDFRTSLSTDAINTSAFSDFHIQLVYADNTLSSPLMLSHYASLVKPVGSGPYTTGQSLNIRHMILQTVRIPMQDLTGGSTNLIRGVRFTFDITPQGEAFFTELAFSRFATASESTVFTLPSLPPPPGTIFNRLLSVASGIGAWMELPDRLIPTPALKMAKRVQVERLPEAPGQVGLEVQSDIPFPVSDALVILMVDGRELAVGDVVLSGDLHSMIFRIRDPELAALPSQFKLKIGFRGESEASLLDLGEFQKSLNSIIRKK